MVRSSLAVGSPIRPYSYSTPHTHSVLTLPRFNRVGINQPIHSKPPGPGGPQGRRGGSASWSSSIGARFSSVQRRLVCRRTPSRCIYGRSVYSCARSVRWRDQISALGWGRARTGTDAHLQESLCALPIPTGGHHTQRLPPSRPGGPKATTVRRRNNSPSSSHGLVSLAAPVCLLCSSIISVLDRSIATVEANAAVITMH